MSEALLGVAGAVLALVAVYLARRDPRWRSVRIGVFLEREQLDDDNSDSDSGRQ